MFYAVIIYKTKKQPQTVFDQRLLCHEAENFDVVNANKFNLNQFELI